MRKLVMLLLPLSMAMPLASFANSANVQDAEKSVESAAFNLGNMISMLASSSPANESNRTLYFNGADLCVYLQLKDKVSQKDIPALNFLINKYKTCSACDAGAVSKLLLANLQGNNAATAKINGSKALHAKCDIPTEKTHAAQAAVLGNRRSLTQLLFARMGGNESSQSFSAVEQDVFDRASHYLIKDAVLFETINKRLPTITKFPGVKQNAQVQALADELAPKLTGLNANQANKIDNKEFINYALSFISLVSNNGH